MSLQYLQDDNGNTTAVVVPIEEWKKFTENIATWKTFQGSKKKLLTSALLL